MAKNKAETQSILPGQIASERAQVSRGEKFLELFQEGREFMKELLKENERLRYRIARLESSSEDEMLDRRTPELEQELKQLRVEKEQMEQYFEEMEQENQDFAERYLSIEDQNNKLANLYVASYQLHSTRDTGEVLQIIKEIIVNLVAADKFVLMVLDEETQRLTSVADEGFGSSEKQDIPVGKGIIGKAAETGEIYLGEDRGSAGDFTHPLACIPLKIKDHCVGVIAIHRLMTQKDGFSAVDYELFDLLSEQAAIAIFSAKLCSESSQERNSIKKFLSWS